MAFFSPQRALASARSLSRSQAICVYVVCFTYEHAFVFVDRFGLLFNVMEFDFGCLLPSSLRLSSPFLFHVAVTLDRNQLDRMEAGCFLFLFFKNDLVYLFLSLFLFLHALLTHAKLKMEEEETRRR